MRRLAIVISVSLFFSCANTIPGKVLEPEKMQDVLSDMLLAEGFTENFLILDSSKTREEWFSQEYSRVMAIHKISQEDFRNSLNFYKKHPDVFKIIVDTVYQRSQRMRNAGFKGAAEKSLRVQ
ncbi:MAG: hypothetical protein RLZZ46_1541 [Bacteroidota bacterium]|jgi:hypothetical protein